MKLNDEECKDTRITKGPTYRQKHYEMSDLANWKQSLEVKIHALRIQLAQAEAAIRERRRRDATD